MRLQDYGYGEVFEASRIEQGFAHAPIGRVISEHRDRFEVMTEDGECEAEISGHMRFSSTAREDLPAVGDWVALSEPDGRFHLIHGVLARKSMLSRQAVGKFGEAQIIATNIDHALLVQALDRDFSPNRLDRYLTICHSSCVAPIVVLTKTDMIDPEALEEILQGLRNRVGTLPIVPLSNITGSGIESLVAILERGATYCMLGSSGVGKSTLLNNLCGRALMKTNAISSSTNKGRHVTSHRALVALETGALLIDNPGMREVGIVDRGRGVETTFDQILRLARDCRFKDCSHTVESGCAVLAAVATGEIDREAHESYLRMEREKAHFGSTEEERRRKDRTFGKMLKTYKRITSHD